MTHPDTCDHLLKPAGWLVILFILSTLACIVACYIERIVLA